MNNNEWQPIETAPKDGTYIILYQPKTLTTYDVIKIGAWVNGLYKDETKKGWLVSFYCDDYCDNYGLFIKPTHWMPIPKKPKTKK